MNFTQLQSENLSLEVLDKTHSKKIHENNVGNVREHFISFKNISEVDEWIIENIKKIQSGEKIETVIKNHFGEFLGMIAIDNLKKNTSEIRLWIKPQMQSKGVGKESLNLIKSWFKNEYPEKALKYVADVNNIPSNSLAKAAGFKFANEIINQTGGKSNEYIL